MACSDAAGNRPAYGTCRRPVHTPVPDTRKRARKTKCHGGKNIRYYEMISSFGEFRRSVIRCW